MRNDARGDSFKGSLGVNAEVVRRLTGIQKRLIASFEGCLESSASKGREREIFLNDYLKSIMPNTLRFGSGDITDVQGNTSGQVDVAVEYAYLPSFPMEKDAPRLYLAEGIAAVIEIKSDLSCEWDEAKSKVERIKSLRRFYSPKHPISPRTDIPCFLVGYKGWKKDETYKEKMEQAPYDGILAINEGLCYLRHRPGERDTSWANDKIYYGPVALWGIATWLFEVMNLDEKGTPMLHYVVPTAIMHSQPTSNYLATTRQFSRIHSEQILKSFDMEPLDESPSIESK